MEEVIELTKDGMPKHTGMFPKGISGNPTGRPKTDIKIKELAQQYTDTAVKTLVEIAQNPKAKDSARVMAANAILDRAYGKPAQYSENLNMNVSYEDYLLELARKEGIINEPF